MITNQRIFLVGVLVAIAGALILMRGVQAGSLALGIVGIAMCITGFGLMAVHVGEGGD